MRNGPNKTAPKPLSAKELVLIEYLADPLDKRTKRQKSKAAGFGMFHVFELQKKPAFQTELYRRTREITRQNLNIVYRRLIQLVQRGGPKTAIAAANTFLRAIGEIQPNKVVQETHVTQTAPDRITELQEKTDDEIREVLRGEVIAVREMGIAPRKRNGSRN